MTASHGFAGYTDSSLRMELAGCPFTERLPLELRRHIYQIVLQDEPAAKYVVKTNNTFAVFNVPLFRVNRSIANESREVFFEANEVYIRPDQILDLLYRHGDQIRQLRIEGRDPVKGLPQPEYFDAAETLTRYSALAPRLKLVTWDCHGLHDTARQLVKHLINIVKFFKADLDLSIDDFRCTEVGTYSLHIPETSQEWRFSYTLLADLWHSWTRQPAYFHTSSQDVEDYFSLRGPVRIPRWIFFNAQARSIGMDYHNLLGLGSLLNRYHSVETMLPSLKPQAAQLDVLRRFELLGGWKIKEAALHGCLEFAGSLDLESVRSCHGADTLEWATELLAPNTKDFAAEFGQSIEEAEEFIRQCNSW